MKLSSSSIKKFLIFPQKKTFLIFQGTETLKNFPSSKKHSEKISHISGNRTF